MNIKNNILAGVCIFIIVLLMPYYWQMIGYEPSTSEEIINSEITKKQQTAPLIYRYLLIQKKIKTVLI